ncbi:MAG: PAS domain S-box protein [Candidatus Accumulibacter sp.]|uniref:PAS domain S-box protein n=1 Tax=Candidatus Accumulibacter proximus TaxID=2954385 RepID=A0A935UF99_9PROT|nr:PAS domain S-box protein [Candidatus Accumulibacter proximus]
MNAVMDSSCDSIAVLDAHGVIVSVNQVWRAFAESNGGSAALATGIGIDYLAAVRRAAASDSLAAAALQGCEEILAGRQTLFSLEYPCNSPDCERWFELHATPLAGAVKGMVVGHRDVTARKLVERALDHCAVELRDHEHQLTAVLNSVSSMIGYWDRNLRNRFANHAYRDWFGVDPATMPGKHIREVIGEERYRLNLPYIEAVLRGAPQQFERAIPSPDGRSVRHALARYIPDVVDGEVQGFFVEIMDVTSIKRSEQALQRAQEVGRLGSYITDLPSGNWVGSPMLDRIMGISPAYEHTPEGWGRLLHPADRQAVLAYASQVRAEGGKFDRQYRIVRPSDGAVRWMHGLGETEYGEQGVPRHIVGTVQDITERKLAEEELQALLGENTRLVRQLIAVQERERADLARELHDELSQHLTAIRAFAGAMQRDGAPARKRVRASAQAIEDSARAIYEVSHRLMEGLHPNILDAAGIVEAVGSLLEVWGQQHPEIEWRASLDRDLVCNEEQVRVAVYRIVQECLSNVARHASAHRLRLILTRWQWPDTETLRLVVRDDGIGINVGAQHAGFGLLGMRERVLSLGGSLQISRPRGGGTRVRVFLPNDGVAPRTGVDGPLRVR